MFAAALWTESRQRLVWYATDGHQAPLLLSPRRRRLLRVELKAIFSSIRKFPAIESWGPRIRIFGKLCSRSQTLIAGFLKLPPGHFWNGKQGRTRTKQWSRRPLRSLARNRSNPLRKNWTIFCGSGSRASRFGCSPGVWASGGLDSSTVLHTPHRKCVAC